MPIDAKRALLNARQQRRRFLSMPWAGGVVLLGCVVVAMVLANLPATRALYRTILETNLALRISNSAIDWSFPNGMTVERLVNDGLMVVFFFVVGLEIKREVISGQLSSLRQAILPIIGALGGMAVPALIFICFNHGTLSANGWGIPTATDIAFAIGILSLLGDRVPVSLKIFLTALAVADDLGAILIIAFFYGQSVSWIGLAIALALLLLLWGLNRMGETRTSFYLVPAVVVWALFYYSGIHATLSGVAMAMVLPVRPACRRPLFVYGARRIVSTLERLPADCSEGAVYGALRRVRSWSVHAVGLSSRWEQALSPYVTFFIMPVFALANAGVRIDRIAYFDLFRNSPETGFLAAGIFFGLVVGKPLGIFLSSRLAVRTGIAVRPQGATWGMLFAVACLGGIGFTMSIFVDALAFAHVDEPLRSVLVNQGKIAVLLASLVAGGVGALMIRLLNLSIRKKG